MTDARAFRGFRSPAEVILWAVRWYLQFPVSYRDLERMLADRGVEVDHVSLFRWVQRCAPELEKRVRRHLRPCRGPWPVDETLIPSANSRVAVLPLEVIMSLRPEPIGETVVHGSAGRTH
jgi:transposase-like protein